MRTKAKTVTSGATMLAAAAIIGAYGFQYIGGFVPCDLCFAQRNPYYVGIPVLLICLFMWDALNTPVRTGLIGAAALIFAYSTWMGGYHSGVEWGWWAGPDKCAGIGAGLSDFSLLDDINAAVIIPCDQAQARFFGLSFAGMNAAVSLVVTGALLFAGHCSFHAGKNVKTQ